MCQLQARLISSSGKPSYSKAIIARQETSAYKFKLEFWFKLNVGTLANPYDSFYDLLFEFSVYYFKHTEKNFAAQTTNTRTHRKAYTSLADGEGKPRKLVIECRENEKQREKFGDMVGRATTIPAFTKTLTIV